MTALHRDAFGALLPFPDLRDGLGPRRALERAGRRARAGRSGSSTPRRSATCGPSPAHYPRDAAMAEAEAFLDGRAYVTREQAGETLAEHRAL